MTFNSHRTSLWARAILLAIGKRAKTPCMGFLCTHYICKCKHALNMYSSAHCVLIQCRVCSRPVRTTRRSRILLRDPRCPGSPAYMHPSTGEGSVAPWDWSVCRHPICMHLLGRGWRQIRIDACTVVLFMTTATGNRRHLGVGFPHLPP